MRSRAAIRVTNPRNTFTFNVRALPGRIDVEIRQFSLRTLALAFAWFCIFLLATVGLVRVMPRGINMGVALLGGALCLVPLLYMNGCFHRSHVTFEPLRIQVRVRRLLSFHSASGAPSSLQLFGLDYRGHGQPGFAIDLDEKKFLLALHASDVDVTALLEQLSQHARAMNHPAFDSLRYDRDQTAIYSPLAPRRNY